MQFFLLALVGWTFCSLARPCECHAADRDGSGPKSIRQSRSKNILLYSDVSSADAKQTLTLLESRLRRLSKYWGCPLRTPIECVLTQAPSQWPLGATMDRDAQVTLERVGGFTRIVGNGRSTHAQMYTINDRHVAVHEIVHAYCGTTFRSAPPAWYKEGTAEYFANMSAPRLGLQGTDDAFDVLRTSRQRSISEITNDIDFTANIAASVRRASMDGSPGWLQSDDRNLKEAQQSYYWSWLLVHFLAENENYCEPFRQYGVALRQGNSIDFSDHFVHVKDRMDAEFAVFARTLQQGYHVRSASWVWKPTGTVSRNKSTIRLAADRGFQSMGFRLSSGGRYHVRLSGRADPAHEIEAIVVDSGNASRSFRLTGGSFTSEHSGQLFLRLSGDWSSLRGQKGNIQVEIVE